MKQKNLNKRNIWQTIAIIGIIIFAYFTSRLLNLSKLPIFTDEAIYIRWSQIGANDAAWRFISLTDGKQPLFTWIMMIFFKILKGFDPLVIGRLTSVFSGFFTLMGIMSASFLIFKNRSVMFLTGLLYIIIPFTLMYDRLALYDSMVSMFSVWSLWFSIMLFKYIKLDLALLLGMNLGLGFLNKSSALFSLLLSPVALILSAPKKRNIEFFRYFGFLLIAFLLSQVMYNLLRLSPLFHMISRKNTVFIYTFSEWIQNPLAYFWGNIRGLGEWLVQYLTIPVFIMSLVSFFLNKNNLREKLLLFIWFVVPFISLSFFGKVLYPRFVLFMSIPLIMLTAYSFGYILQKYRCRLGLVILMIIFLVPSFFISFTLIRDPTKAQIPFPDRGQMIDNWPSGGGITEVLEYIRDKSESEKIAVYTEGTFGLLPYALEIYEVDNPNIEIKGFWPLESTPSPDIIRSSGEIPTYVLLNLSQSLPSGWNGDLVLEKSKGNIDNIKMRLYKISPTTPNYRNNSIKKI